MVDGYGRLHVRPAGDDAETRLGPGHYRHIPGGEWVELVRVNATMTVENVKGAYNALLRVVSL